MAYADAHGKNPDALGIAPLQRIPLSARDALANNAALMSSAGLRATPATIWKNAQGLVQIRTGMPRAAGRVDGQSSRQVASTLGFKSPHSPTQNLQAAIIALANLPKHHEPT
jgi:hypothetical protein